MLDCIINKNIIIILLDKSDFRSGKVLVLSHSS